MPLRDKMVSLTISGVANPGNTREFTRASLHFAWASENGWATQLLKISRLAHKSYPTPANINSTPLANSFCLPSTLAPSLKRGALQYLI